MAKKDNVFTREEQDEKLAEAVSRVEGPQPKFVRTGVVTVPQFHWSDGETVHMRIETAFEISDFSREGAKPATLCRITNLEDGKQYTLVVNAVFQSSLEKAYPNAAYKGLCFEATKSAERKQGAKGGAYNTFEIYPIQDPG